MCDFAMDFLVDIEIDIIMAITFIINEGGISLYLLYKLYENTKNREIEQQRNNRLSIHFSQRYITRNK